MIALPQTPNKLKSVAHDQATALSTKADHDYSPNHDENQASTTLRSNVALIGYTLSRTTTIDGGVIYLASKWGMFRELKGLEAVAALFALIGGLT